MIARRETANVRRETMSHVSRLTSHILLKDKLMLRTYFKFAFRNLLKNKIHSFLGISSFAFGFAVCLVIALFIQHELTMDTCFENHHRIYKLANDDNSSVHMVYKDKDIYLENFPEIELVCPVESHRGWSRPVYTGEKSVYIQNSIATDSSFLQVFSIPIIEIRIRLY
jgi:putative ABC transport system permease protein